MPAKRPPHASHSTLETEEFRAVLTLITQARHQAVQAVNTALIDLYWQIGGIISHKIASAEWGTGVVDKLARRIAQEHPGLRGFTRPNLFRMRQFHEAYRDAPTVSPLARQIPWSHHLLILAQSKHPEERLFYLQMTAQERWSKRELMRQLKSALFERRMLSPVRATAALSHHHPQALIGVLLCASQDDEVVEYALNRSLSPAMIAQYQTQLPDKKLLQRKLQELLSRQG